MPPLDKCGKYGGLNASYTMVRNGVGVGGFPVLVLMVKVR
jgi:hypothetical protein